MSSTGFSAPISIPTFIASICIGILLHAESSINPLTHIKKDFIDGYKYTLNGSYRRALDTWENWDAPTTVLDDYVLFYQGKSYLGLQRCREAKRVFRELARRFPESRWAPHAVHQASSKQPCPPLVSYAEAVADCEAVPGLRARADCFFESRGYAEAKTVYRELAGTPAEGREDLLVRLSQAAARSGDLETAVWANESLIAEFPEGGKARQARIKLALLDEDAGRWREAASRWRKLWEESADREERSWIGEKLAWRHYRLREFSQAIEALEAVPESPFSLYWLGRSFVKIGKKEAAREQFQRLIERYPGDYYALRALPRISRKGLTRTWWPERRRLDWAKEEEVLPDGPWLEKILALREIGLPNEAMIEVRRFRAVSSPVRSPVRVGEDWPLPHAGFLYSTIAARSGRVPPLLVYAMMKQESHFQPREVSRSGARGLLQIMPQTGERLAGEAGWSDFDPDWLFDPYSNIELAVRYLKNLSRRFGGRWHLMAAAYSAGEQKVAEWLKVRGPLNEEEFIEEIPYDETRDYVKKVYANWQAYRWIYR